MIEETLNYQLVGSHAAVVCLQGDYSVRESLALVRRCLSDPRMILPANLLVDVRRSTASRSTEELQQVARGLSTCASRISEISVVTKSKLYYGLARVVMAFMEESGIRVDISYDYETTLHRLIADAPRETTSKEI